MNYREAMNAGYKDGATSYQRGYVSRRVNPDDQPVQTAGGNKAGKLYVLLPCWTSTRYCIRQYLVKA